MKRTELRDGHKVYRVAGIPGLTFDYVTLKHGGTRVNRVREGEPLTIEIELKADFSDTFVCTYWIHFFSLEGKRVARIESPTDRFKLEEGGIHRVQINLEPQLLAAGEYLISFSVFDISSGSAADTLNCRYEMLARSYHLEIEPTSPGIGQTLNYPAAWSFTSG